MKPKNIYSKISSPTQNEYFEKILTDKNFVLERIISTGQSTPENTWCQQDQDEWVILLKGKAKILFETEECSTLLKPGDYIHIPAYLKHRIQWTDPKTKTIWLALHFLKKQS